MFILPSPPALDALAAAHAAAAKVTELVRDSRARIEVDYCPEHGERCPFLPGGARHE